eukprot:6612615-Prymnesium_polylepis.2
MAALTTASPREPDREGGGTITAEGVGWLPRGSASTEPHLLIKRRSLAAVRERKRPVLALRVESGASEDGRVPRRPVQQICRRRRVLSASVGCKARQQGAKRVSRVQSASAGCKARQQGAKRVSRVQSASAGSEARQQGPKRVSSEARHGAGVRACKRAGGGGRAALARPTRQCSRRAGQGGVSRFASVRRAQMSMYSHCSRLMLARHDASRMSAS